MGWLGRFFGGLWQLARRSRISIDHDLRPGSGASTLYVFLFLFFAIVAAVLLLLGFDLNEVDLWLEAQGGWLDVLGTWLFRLLCGIVLFFCVFAIGGGLWQRTRPPDEEDRIGWGGMLFALILGYFAWFGMTG